MPQVVPHFLISKRILARLLLYNMVVWFVFWTIYRNIDFTKHFEVPPVFKQTWDSTAYFAFQVQTQMFGTNIVPKTSLGRSLVAIHGLLAWGQTIIFLAPFFAVASKKES